MLDDLLGWYIWYKGLRAYELLILWFRRSQSNRRASFYLVRCRINRVPFLFPPQHSLSLLLRGWCRGEWSFSSDQLCYLTPSWEQLTPVPSLEGDLRESACSADRLARGLASSTKSESPASALVLRPGVQCAWQRYRLCSLQISIHPPMVAFKLLWELFCFVTHNILMGYCARLLNKIYPLFNLFESFIQLTADSRDQTVFFWFVFWFFFFGVGGLRNIAQQNFDIGLSRIISWPSLISLWVIIGFPPKSSPAC